MQAARRVVSTTNRDVTNDHPARVSTVCRPRPHNESAGGNHADDQGAAVVIAAIEWIALAIVTFTAVTAYRAAVYVVGAA